ncbi:hypothetical protein BJV82DRAFT_78002 [Fennellomyces sp. T-0311]|nr:hypothetical protein BJV82DRAFT_538694 [Fennellomyces sp. T-0311]KAI8144156.1 hypothetical protein BJV82DRAFT_78002 [Fennellomyces sp. T-0311]
MPQPDIILHWYPLSPFAQELAWVLNYKNIDYKVVQISPIEPRPLRRPLDGGYRKTPILQIGNQVYCDTKRIIDELEKRYPEPSLYPKTKSGESSKELGRAIAVWFDSFLFGSISKQFDVSLLPEKFKKDRDQFIGQKFGGGSPYMRIDLVAQIAQVQALLGNKPYVLDTPTLSFADLSLAKDTFFLANILGPDWVETNAPAMYKHFIRITEEAKMSRTENLPKLKAEQALEVAQKQAQPYTGQQQCTLPELKVGQIVSVEPLDTGITPSTGILRNLTQDEIVIEHKTDKITSIIYFPAVGFTVSPGPKPSL